MKRKRNRTSGSGVTIHAVATALGLTERRIRQLRDDGIISALSDGRFDLDEARVCYAAFAGGDFERGRFLDGVAEMVADVDADITRLAGASDAKKPAIAEAIGPRVGRLIGRLRVCPNLSSGDARRAFERDAVEAMCGRLVAAFLAAAAVELEAG